MQKPVKPPVSVGKYLIGPSHPFTVIAGPCVIESLELALATAEQLKQLAERLGIQIIYKSSYDKANRSSASSPRGPGIDKGLRILEEVKKRFALPVTSDIHLPEEAAPAATVLDLLQIPAFLCRQTDLVLAAARTQKPVNVKKGQFVSPWDMKNVVEKVESQGNASLILTERGTSFGYNNLTVDMRSFPIMKSFGYPVCFDASHSVMLPGGHGSRSGGQREFIPTLTYAAMAAGADLLFIETHPSPENALSDKDSVYPLDQLEPLLKRAMEIRELMMQPQLSLC